MEYEKLHQNSKKSWFLARLIVTIVMGVVFLGGRFILGEITVDTGAVEYAFVGDIVMLGIFVLLLLNTFIYPAFEYKQWKYAITSDKVEFSEGIFFTKRTTIPIVRVQHIQINQGPINRWLKLADITISTAGGQHKIPNIHISKAEEIGDYLKNKIKEKVEDNV